MTNTFYQLSNEELFAINGGGFGINIIKASAFAISLGLVAVVAAPAIVTTVGAGLLLAGGITLVNAGAATMIAGAAVHFTGK